jgi:hypothetical protein
VRGFLSVPHGPARRLRFLRMNPSNHQDDQKPGVVMLILGTLIALTCYPAYYLESIRNGFRRGFENARRVKEAREAAKRT